MQIKLKSGLFLTLCRLIKKHGIESYNTELGGEICTFEQIKEQVQSLIDYLESTKRKHDAGAIVISVKDWANLHHLIAELKEQVNGM